jgi:hypothetical protein
VEALAGGKVVIGLRGQLDGVRGTGIARVFLGLLAGCLAVLL